MRTISNAVFTVTYPNELIETRGKFAYIKVQLATPAENVNVTLSFTVNPDIILTRKTDASGVAIFPIGRMMESLGRSAFYISALEQEQLVSAVWPIAGYAKNEIKDGFDNNSFYPARPVVIIYPNLNTTQSLFFPCPTELSVLSQSGVEIGYADFGPIVEFEASKIPEGDMGKNIGFATEPGAIAVEIKTYYDYCTSGVFLKWTDAAGVPYLYRWTQEVETDEVSVDSTYRQLDDTLTPYDVQVKTRAKRFTLHSRIVERDIFEMCRTILGAQEVFMYDRDANDWVRVLIEDAESEDTGAVMQDVEIEVVKYEYL